MGYISKARAESAAESHSGRSPYFFIYDLKNWLPDYSLFVACGLWCNFPCELFSRHVCDETLSCFLLFEVSISAFIAFNYCACWVRCFGASSGNRQIFAHNIDCPMVFVRCWAVVQVVWWKLPHVHKPRDYTFKNVERLGATAWKQTTGDVQRRRTHNETFATWLFRPVAPFY